MTLDIYLHAFVPPGPPFSATIEEKRDYPRISTTQVDLKDYPEFHEVMGVYMVLIGNMPEGHTMKFNFNFYNDATNKLLYGGEGIIPQPSTEDHDWWDWYSWLAWIGRCAWEINGPMIVRVEVTSSGSPLGTEKKIVYMTIVDTSIPPPLPTIKETINWEAVAPTPHTFYLVSLYGKDIDGTLEGFQPDGSGGGIIITTLSTTRTDSITSSNITNFDCLTLIYDGKTTIFDWKIDKNVV